MPLPETVIQQLGRETPHTPGWSLGVISFSGGIFFIAVFLWAGLAYGYKPLLDGQAGQVEGQIKQIENSVSTGDQANLINFYSQLSNLQSLLAKHKQISNIFSWIESNTEVNVYYTSFSLSSSGRISLGVNAKTEADANQQIAIFESSPQVQGLTVSGISYGNNGYWQFVADFSIDPSAYGSPNSTTTPAQ